MTLSARHRRARSLSPNKDVPAGEIISKWSVFSLTQGNIGLHKAVDSMKDQLEKRVWIGLAGDGDLDSLSETTKSNIKSELYEKYDCVPVYVNDADFEGHYIHFCKEVGFSCLLFHSYG